MEIKENIYPELIFVEKKEFDKNEMMEYLVEKISSFKGRDYNEILAAVNQREEKLTTAIGLNAAIPHARLDNWGNTVIACLKADKIKNYSSMDNSEVKIVFLFISDKEKPCEHVNIMSKISYIIADNSNIDILKSIDNKDEFYNSIIEMCDTL